MLTASERYLSSYIARTIRSSQRNGLASRGSWASGSAGSGTMKRGL